MLRDAISLGRRLGRGIHSYTGTDIVLPAIRARKLGRLRTPRSHLHRSSSPTRRPLQVLTPVEPTPCETARFVREARIQQATQRTNRLSSSQLEHR